jgi:glycogen(starch) synthase
VRILVLTDLYPPFYEGAYELNCQQVTDGLRARRHTVVVLTTTYGLAAPAVNGHVHRILHFCSLRYRGVFHRRWMQLRLFFQTRQNYRITRRVTEETNPELAFIWNAEAVSILPILAVQDWGVPTIFRIGSHWLVHRWNEYVKEPSRLKRWYRASLMGFRSFAELEFDAAILVSETLRQSHRQAGLNIKTTAVIANGVPEEWIARHPGSHRKSDGMVRLLFAGRLEAEKGPDVAVQAVEHLVKVRGYHNVCLDLAGKGQKRYLEALNQYIVANGLQRFVRLIGFLPREELIQRYSEYDVFLFPSLRWEGFGLTIIEAMSQGVPVVASDIGGPKDIIEDGQNGFLVTPGEPLELADAIEKLIKTPLLAAEVALAAIEAVRQKYIFDAMLDRYEVFLESLTSSDVGRR